MLNEKEESLSSRQSLEKAHMDRFILKAQCSTCAGEDLPTQYSWQASTWVYLTSKIQTCPGSVVAVIFSPP